jgi:hypothetical protein
MDQAPAFQAGDAGSIPAGRSNLNRTSSGRPSGRPRRAASFTLVIGDGRPGEVARRHLFEAAMGLNGVALLEDRMRTRRSRGFESLQVHHGDVAHLEERRVRTAKAAGSSPAVSTAPRRWSGWSRTPFRKRLGRPRVPSGVRVPPPPHCDPWCSGSTPVFGTGGRGSNPRGSATGWAVLQRARWSITIPIGVTGSPPGSEPGNRRSSRRSGATG